MNCIDKSGEFMGKAVLVTGGTMGIGEGCARAFCSAGANVVICARGVEWGMALEKELNGTMPGKCLFKKCDVNMTEEIKNLIDFIAVEYGRLDCLINNAGFHPADATIDEITVDEFINLMQLNLVSMFAACKYSLPHLRRTRGSIINMSSLVGSIGQVKSCSYVATKSAITGLTKALAIDEALNGVRVNAVSPACIDTPLADKIMNMAENPERELRRIKSWHHLNRQGTIEEVGKVCLFLASDAASFITGVDLPVSGGAELGYGDKFVK